MVKAKRNINRLSVIISAAILLYLSQPYYFWSPTLQSLYVRIFLVFILGGFVYVNRKKFENIDSLLLLFFLFTGVLYWVTSGNNIYYFVAYLPVVLIPFANKDYFRTVFDMFLKIYCALISLALVSWVLAMIGAIGPYKTIPPLNDLKLGSYYVFPFMVSEHNPVQRFFGMYDEPGVVGTISALMLCINNFDIKKKTTWILLVSGLCSQSLFFYVIFVIYALGYSMTVSKRIGTKILWVAVIGLGVLAVTRIPALQESIGERLEWDDSRGGFVGDNRIDPRTVDLYLSQMQGNSSLWWGIKDKSSFWEETAGASSIWMFIIVNGVVFISLYVLFFLGYSISRSKNVWTVLLFMCVFIGTIYQRPSIFNALYVFLFCCLASQINSNTLFAKNKITES